MKTLIKEESLEVVSQEFLKSTARVKLSLAAVYLTPYHPQSPFLAPDTKTLTFDQYYSNFANHPG